MKSLIVPLLMCCLVPAPAAHTHDGIFNARCDEADADDLARGKCVDIDYRNDAIVFEKLDSDEVVKITEDHKLFINGERIDLRRSERRRVKAYFDQYHKIMEEAEDIVREGARVGEAGAKIAVKAVARALAGIGEDCDDMERLEDELEEMETEIEKEAGKLKRRAEKIEREAEELKDLHCDLRRKIQELDRLGWF